MATQTKLVTYDDYQHLPDDGNRYEIIGGELFMAPSPNTKHQKISANLFFLLKAYIVKHNLGELLYAPMDVILSMTDVVEPDLLFIDKRHREIITEKNIVAAPDLVVEILSESTEEIDRNEKKELYEKYKVKEYWMVNPEKQQVEQYVLSEEMLELKGIFNKSDSLTSHVVTGFEIQLEKVFAI